MTGTQLSTLRTALSKFDGNAVSMLSEIDAAYKKTPGYLDTVIEYVGDSDPMIQRGASWIFLDHAKSNALFAPETCSLLSVQLNRVTDWGAALHVLQALEHYDGRAKNVDTFSEFIKANLAHKRPFLRAWSMSALCRLAQYHPTLKADADAALTSATEDQAASVRARARRLHKQM